MYVVLTLAAFKSTLPTRQIKRFMTIGPLHDTVMSVSLYKKLCNCIFVPCDWVLQRAYYQLGNVPMYVAQFIKLILIKCKLSVKSFGLNYSYSGNEYNDSSR